MPWFLVAISGYFINAIVGVADKFLLGQKATTKPPVYTFYVGLLSIFALILAPFGLFWPGWVQFLIAFLTGALFLFGLLYLFEALDIGEASRVFVFVGGLTPVLVLALSFFFLGERLSGNQILAFFLLVLGGIVISFKKGDAKKYHGRSTRFVIVAILLTSVSLILTKFVFSNLGFINGFIWTRMGLFGTALLFLISKNQRRAIFSAGRQTKSALNLILVLNRVMAGLASLAINFSIARASVALIKALEGSQYVFLFVITLILSRKFPNVLEEKISLPILIQKSLAIFLIVVGLIILAK